MGCSWSSGGHGDDAWRAWGNLLREAGAVASVKLELRCCCLGCWGSGSNGAAMGDQDPVILASYGSHRGGVNALHFRPHMKHVVSGGADSAVLLWSLHCRPNLRHPVVRPYRFLGHQVIILPQFTWSWDTEFSAMYGEWDRLIDENQFRLRVLWVFLLDASLTRSFSTLSATLWLSS